MRRFRFLPRLLALHLLLTLLSSQETPMISRGFTTGSAHQRATFEDAARWGATNLRVGLSPPKDVPAERYWEAFETTTVREAEIAVRNAQGTGVKVILTFGSLIPGVDRDQHEYWAHPDLERMHVEAWRRIATRLLPLRANVFGFDLINEPLDRSVVPRPPAAWRGLAIKIIAAIREVDPDTWIIFEPGPGGTFAGFFDLEPLPDAKVMYSGHFYFPHMFTHQGVHNVAGTELTKAMTQVNVPYPLPVADLKAERWELDFHRLPDLQVFDRAAMDRIAAPALEFQRKHKVPFYLGEFSVIRWAPHDAALRYLGDVVDLCEANGWSWSYHAFREFNGWSLEHGDSLDWIQGMPSPPFAPGLTDRARLILKALARNASPRQDLPAVEATQTQRGAVKPR
jgi:endoglucanase